MITVAASSNCELQELHEPSGNPEWLLSPRHLEVLLLLNEAFDLGLADDVHPACDAA